MQSAGSLEWVVQNPPFLSVMARRGGKSLLIAAAMLFCAGIFFAWLYLSVEIPGAIPFLYVPLGAAGLTVIAVVPFVAVAMAMRAIGFGYAYRLDEDGLTFRYYLGRTPPEPHRIPPRSERGSEDASLGGFGGWALWSWLRGREMRMERLEKLGLVVLRRDEQPGWIKKDEPAVFLFCGGAERLAVVAGFVADRLR